MKQKIAVFPGSFDPITLGHIGIVEKALPLFDKIIVAIGENSGKNSLFSLDEKLKQVHTAFKKFPKVEVASYKGLTVDFCHHQKAEFILRGLRDVKDFEFEKSIAAMNAQLNNGIQSIFLMTQPEFAAINSSIVREILKNKGDASAFLPNEILKLITIK